MSLNPARTGSKTSSLAGDAREHAAIDDEAPEVHQEQMCVARDLELLQ
jgi:hypothetical protein